MLRVCPTKEDRVPAAIPTTAAPHLSFPFLHWGQAPNSPCSHRTEKPEVLLGVSDLRSPRVGE